MQDHRSSGARHDAAGELIHDDHLALLHQVILVALEQHVSLQGLLHVMQNAPVFRLVEIAAPQQLFHFGDAFFGERGAAMLFFHRVIAGGVVFARLLALDLLAAHQFRDDAVDLVIFVGGFFAGPGNNQRRARFVDQNGVYFVDDGEVMAALHAIVDAELHVVAQIVEAVLVIGAVGDVAGIARAPLLVIEIMHDDPHRHPQELVDAAHPFGVAFGKVVVHGDHVDAFAFETVQINRQSRD